MLFRVVPLIVVATLVGLAIAHFNTKKDSDDFSMFPIFLPVIAIVVSTSVYRMLKQQKQLFESYVLSIDETSITREQRNTPTITISKWEVSEIPVLRKYAWKVLQPNVLVPDGSVYYLKITTDS